jgi:hypothetical protein
MSGKFFESKQSLGTARVSALTGFHCIGVKTGRERKATCASLQINATME